MKQQVEQQVATPDRTGVVLGYRAWHLVSNPGTPVEVSLRAANMTIGARTPWRVDGPTVAVCRARNIDPGPLYSCLVEGCSDPPQWDCHCGLHARAWAHGNAARYNPLHVLVYGAVLAWGRIIYHEQDSFFRARKMLPIAFIEVPSYEALLGWNGFHVGYLHAQHELSVEKLTHVSAALAAPILPDQQALQAYAQEEAQRW